MTVKPTLTGRSPSWYILNWLISMIQCHFSVKPSYLWNQILNVKITYLSTSKLIQYSVLVLIPNHGVMSLDSRPTLFSKNLLFATRPPFLGSMAGQDPNGKSMLIFFNLDKAILTLLLTSLLRSTIESDNAQERQYLPSEDCIR